MTGTGTLMGMGTHVIAVVGATATGKSGLAIELARALGGEVVNADSMQLYRGMDIGTAKEPEAAWQGVPHHLLDIWPVTRTANVADYQKLARAAIDDIIARGRVPVLAGGSGLYVRAALDDLNFPGTDHGTRARLEAELAGLGPAALHARLATLDPAAAAAILPGNGRRIVRALEVIELTGGPFTATMPAYEQVRPAVQIGLTLPRPELDQRIAARVDRMWQAGFEAEVRRTWSGRACGTARPPAAPSATSRCSATWTASSPWTKRARRRSRPPGGSPAARSPGSAATPASAGSTPPRSPCWPRPSASRSPPSCQLPELRGQRVRGQQPQQQVWLDGPREAHQSYIWSPRA